MLKLKVYVPLKDFAMMSTAHKANMHCKYDFKEKVRQLLFSA